MKSISDQHLINFLTECEGEILASTFELMNSVLSFESGRVKIFTNPDNVAALSTDERRKLAVQAVERLGYFGSDSFAYASRKLIRMQPGVNYQIMVRDVAVLLNNELRKPFDMPLGSGKALKFFSIAHGKPLIIPKVASVSDYEKIIVELLLSNFIEGKSIDELGEIFRGCDLDREQATMAALKLSKFGVTGTMLIFLVRLLGKKAVKEIVLVIVAQLLEKYLGREATRRIMEKLAKKTTQKVFAKIVSGIGWALIGVDIIKLGGAATRITVPTVAFLSSVKTVSALGMES